MRRDSLPRQLPRKNSPSSQNLTVVSAGAKRGQVWVAVKVPLRP